MAKVYVYALQACFGIILCFNLVGCVKTSGQAEEASLATESAASTQQTGQGQTGVIISISPGSVSTLTGGQSIQFTASVSGTTNQGINYSLNYNEGSISSTGLYTTPASVSAWQTVTAIFSSVADPTATVSIPISLMPGSVAGASPTPTAAPSSTPTPTASPTATPTSTPAPTATPTPGPSATPAPAVLGIYNLVVSGLASNSVTITFSSGIAATGGVTYNAQGGASQSVGDNGNVVNHSVTLSGLNPNTPYSFFTFAYVGSSNTQGNSLNFTTSASGSSPSPTPTAAPTATPTASPTATPSASPTAAPTATASPTAAPSVLGIYNLSTGSIGSNSVTISFSSGISATGGITYYPTNGSSSSVGDNGNLVNHAVAISGLTPNTTYNFFAFAYVGSSSAQGTSLTFTTSVPGTNPTPTPSPTATPTPSPTPSASPVVRYIGRWDFSDPAGARSTWSGSAVTASFVGTSVSATINTPTIDKNPYYVAIVDGGVPSRIVGTVGQYTYQIASGLTNGPHTVQISREFEAFYGVTQFIGFNFGGGTAAAPPAPAALKMEVVGDSISCGYGNIGPVGYPSAANNNQPACTGINTNNESNYMAYGSVLGRMIGAEVSTVCYSGLGIYRNYAGQTDSPTTPTMDEQYLDLLTVSTGINLHQYLYPASGQTATPMDVVVINLGTNDIAAGTPTASQFETSYKKLVSEVRVNSPNAQIFMTIGPNAALSQIQPIRGYLTDLVSYYAALGDTKVHQVIVDPQDISQGVGCDFHPTTAEDLRMSTQLGSQIQQVMGISVAPTDPNPLLSW